MGTVRPGITRLHACKMAEEGSSLRGSRDDGTGLTGGVIPPVVCVPPFLIDGLLVHPR